MAELDLATFPPHDKASWRRRVEAELGSAAAFAKLRSGTFEGFALEPLYTAEDAPPPEAVGLPGLPPYTRGAAATGGWGMVQEVDHPVFAQAKEAVERDVQRAAAGVWLRFDAATRAGLDAGALAGEAAAARLAAGGVVVADAGELAALLAPLELERSFVVLDAGAAAGSASALLLAVAAERGVPPAALHGCLGFDPLGTLAEQGSPPGGLAAAFAEQAAFARWATTDAPGLAAALVSSRPVHDAGASAVAELATLLAGGVDTLRHLMAGGLSLEAAAGQIQFAAAVSGEIFLEIAKLRAARKAWARIVGLAGGSAAAQSMHLHVRGSSRTRTRHDRAVNALRATAETFAAAVGGAATISTTRFDEALGPGDRFSRKLAANTQRILAEESHLGRVADAAGGSWFVENLTERLCEGAWAFFQEIEAAGGMGRFLLSGAMAERLAATAGQRLAAAATRRDQLTGVNEFPNLDEAPYRPLGLSPETSLGETTARLAAARGRAPAALAALAASPAGEHLPALFAAARAGVSLGELISARALPVGESMPPLPRIRPAAAFERLRAASARLGERLGRRPKVFLAALGASAAHRARVGFSQALVAVGGIEAVVSPPLASADEAGPAFAAAGTPVVILCGSDEDYAVLAGSAARSLAAHGARELWLAGRPGAFAAELEAAGVTAFVFQGMDVVAGLGAMLRALGEEP